MSRSSRSARLVAALALLLAATLAAPATAAAQHATVLGASLADLDSATGAALLRELDAAVARGIPTAPLLAKAREGRLKRASGPRIRQAVTVLATRLDSARAALGPTATVEELSAGADALAAGATPDALRAVRTVARQPSLSVPLGALAQLVANGVSPRRATSMVVDLLRRSASSAQLIAFGNAVEIDVAAGLPADESATFRLRAASGAVGAADAALSGTATSTQNLSTPRASTAPGSPRRRP